MSLFRSQTLVAVAWLSTFCLSSTAEVCMYGSCLEKALMSETSLLQTQVSVHVPKEPDETAKDMVQGLEMLQTAKKAPEHKADAKPDKEVDIGEVPSFLQLHPNAFRFWGRIAATLIENDESQTPVVNPPASSSEPYNLQNSNMGSFSQVHQDLTLLPVLSQIKNGFFVESGALDGEFHSNTLMYEMSYNWTGLLVEPDPRYVPDIKAKNRRAYLYGGCLSPSDSAMKLAFEVNEIPGLSSISASGSYEVQAQPLHVLLETIGQNVVDFWSLDIEGSEGTVLQHTDFSKFEVGILLIETNKNDENNMLIDATMQKNGFVKVGPVAGGQDTVFANPAYFTKRNLPLPTLTMLGR